jgi:hypothetical protein
VTHQDFEFIVYEGMSVRLSPASGDEVTALLINNLLR